MSASCNAMSVSSSTNYRYLQAYRYCIHRGPQKCGTWSPTPQSGWVNPIHTPLSPGWVTMPNLLVLHQNVKAWTKRKWSDLAYKGPPISWCGGVSGINMPNLAVAQAAGGVLRLVYISLVSKSIPTLAIHPPWNAHWSTSDKWSAPWAWCGQSTLIVGRMQHEYVAASRNGKQPDDQQMSMMTRPSHKNANASDPVARNYQRSCLLIKKSPEHVKHWTSIRQEQLRGKTMD